MLPTNMAKIDSQGIKSIQIPLCFIYVCVCQLTQRPSEQIFRENNHVHFGFATSGFDIKHSKSSDIRKRVLLSIKRKVDSENCNK